MKSSAKEKSGHNSGESASLVPQAHGGALLSGGVPGNRGGPGRPRSKVKELSALEYEKRIPLLGEIADDDGEKASDRIRAVDVLGRHGGLQGKGLDRDAVIRLLEELADAVQAVVPDAAEVVFERWKLLVREHVPVD